MPFRLGDAERAAARLRSLLGVLRGRRPVLIVTHDQPDPDALAAAAAVRYLLAEHADRAAVIAHGGTLGRPENRAMARLLAIPLVPLAEVRFERFGPIVLVDTQYGMGNHSLPPNRVPAVVLDHHPPAEPAIETFRDVRPEYGASSTIAAEYLAAAGLTPPAWLATALYNGIRTDTQELSRHASPADEAAYAALGPLVDRQILARIAYPPLPRSHYAMLRRAVERAVIFPPLVVSVLDEVRNPDSVSEIADLLARYEGADWAATLGIYRGVILLSLRSTRADADAGAIAARAVDDLGTAGGHPRAAAGRVEARGLGRAARRALQWDIVERLRQAIGARLEPHMLVPRRRLPGPVGRLARA
jgi:nanoRNase/pAp phosphatase (c-di-AMP/oligoRNAs hydrolase)